MTEFTNNETNEKVLEVKSLELDELQVTYNANKDVDLLFKKIMKKQPLKAEDFSNMNEYEIIRLVYLLNREINTAYNEIQRLRVKNS